MLLEKTLSLYYYSLQRAYVVVHHFKNVNPCCCLGQVDAMGLIQRIHIIAQDQRANCIVNIYLRHSFGLLAETYVQLTMC